MYGKGEVGETGERGGLETPPPPLSELFSFGWFVAHLVCVYIEWRKELASGVSQVNRMHIQALSTRKSTDFMHLFTRFITVTRMNICTVMMRNKNYTLLLYNIGHGVLKS